MFLHFVKVEISRNGVNPVHLLVIRNILIDDTERLRTEQLNMEREISALQLRWTSVREEKIRVANSLSNIKRVDEELDSLSEEKRQLELDLKVICSC